MMTRLRGGQRLAGGADAPGIEPLLGAFAVERVDDLVRDAVANLVGMAFGNGFAREQKGFACHPGPHFARRNRAGSAGFMQCLHAWVKTAGQSVSRSLNSGIAVRCRGSAEPRLASAARRTLASVASLAREAMQAIENIRIRRPRAVPRPTRSRAVSSPASARTSSTIERRTRGSEILTNALLSSRPSRPDRNSTT